MQVGHVKLNNNAMVVERNSEVGVQIPGVQCDNEYVEMLPIYYSRFQSSTTVYCISFYIKIWLHVSLQNTVFFWSVSLQTSTGTMQIFLNSFKTVEHKRVKLTVIALYVVSLFVVSLKLCKMPLRGTVLGELVRTANESCSPVCLLWRFLRYALR